MPSPELEQDYSQSYPTIEEMTRNKLLDAGIRCLQRYGISKTSIRQIAEESGLARQTVYHYFSNKEGLLLAAFEREGFRLGLAAAGHIARFPDVEDKFVEAFIYIYEGFPKNPILAKVIEPGSDFFHTFGMANYSYAAYGELVFAEVFAEHPYLKPQSDSIAELWIRGIMSFLMMPGPHAKNREELTEFIKLRLVPGLGLR